MSDAVAFAAAASQVGGFFGARGMLSNGGQISFPDTVILGCRFTTGVVFIPTWVSPPAVNGAPDETMYLEGSYIGKLGPGAPWRWNDTTPEEQYAERNTGQNNKKRIRFTIPMWKDLIKFFSCRY